MALMEVLQDRCEVTLVTGAPFDCARLNRDYHTRVDEHRIAVRVAPMPQILRKAQAGDALRGAYIGRFIRRVAKDFDLCISTYNLAPFGRPAIQFVADFSWDDEIRYALPQTVVGVRGLMQSPSLARSAYIGACKFIDDGEADLRTHVNNTVVANSQWTADLLKSRHNLDSRVIYPPAFSIPFNADAPRTGDFVMLGRITADKRILEAIEVLSRVRARGHAFGLHVVGTLDNSAYSARVRALAAQHGSWVYLEGGVFGEEKFHLLARHSYALHMREYEAFGIAVAEQVKMGLIPFIRAQSGPAEIVDDQRLCFVDLDDAVEVIDRMLRDARVQRDIRTHLEGRGAMFSQERFMAESGALIEQHLAGRTLV